MFSILYPAAPQRKKRRFHRAAVPQVTVLRSAAGLPFYAVPVVCDGAAADWQGAFAQARHCAPRVISACGDLLPAPLRRELFYPAAGAAELAFGAAVRILSLCGGNPSSRRITVLDPGGVLGERVLALLPLAREVSVVTGAPGNYARAAAAAMENFGAALLFPDSPGREGITVFTPQNSAGQTLLLRVNGAALCAGAVMPEKWRGRVPAGTDALCFAGALRELCGEKTEERELFSSFRFRGVSAGAKETAGAAARFLQSGEGNPGTY